MNRRLLLLLSLLLLCLPDAAFSQLKVGIGLQAGFDNMPNANVPIDRYNDRAFLYRPMNKFHWPFGEIYQVSYLQDRAFASLNLNTRRQRATAKSTDANGIYQRDVRFTMQALSLAGGYALKDEDPFALFIGAAVDAGFMRLSTRQGPESQINRTDYYVFRRAPMLAGSFFFKFVFRQNRESITSWSLTPYVHIPFQKFDFIYLEQLLNQGSLPVYTDPLPARPLNVGLAFNFDLDLIHLLAD